MTIRIIWTRANRLNKRMINLELIMSDEIKARRNWNWKLFSSQRKTNACVRGTYDYVSAEIILLENSNHK